MRHARVTAGSRPPCREWLIGHTHCGTGPSRVDLLGRLSNPPDTLETIAGQGVVSSSERSQRALEAADLLPHRLRIRRSRDSGTAFKPRARRQTRRRRCNRPTGCSAGSRLPTSTTSARATSTGARSTSWPDPTDVNRTTIIKHLDQHGVPRRRVVSKMTDALVAEAAVMYLDGHSLATVANEFKVDTRTLGREFRKAGVPIRPRRGWTY